MILILYHLSRSSKRTITSVCFYVSKGLASIQCYWLLEVWGRKAKKEILIVLSGSGHFSWNQFKFKVRHREL